MGANDKNHKIGSVTEISRKLINIFTPCWIIMNFWIHIFKGTKKHSISPKIYLLFQGNMFWLTKPITRKTPDKIYFIIDINFIKEMLHYWEIIFVFILDSYLVPRLLLVDLWDCSNSRTYNRLFANWHQSNLSHVFPQMTFYAYTIKKYFVP